MKMKKLLSVVLFASIVINLFCLSGNAEDTHYNEMDANEFFQLVQVFTNKHIGEGATSGGISIQQPINRLIVKTTSNSPLKDTYGAIDVLEGYGCLHILQFDSPSKMDAAYESLVNSDDVEYIDYDFWLKLDDDALTNRLLACFCPEDITFAAGCQCPSNTNNYYFCSKKDETAPEGHLSWVSSAVMVDEAFELINNSGIEVNSVDVAVFDTGVYAEHSEFLMYDESTKEPVEPKISYIKTDNCYSLFDTDKDGNKTAVYNSDIDDFFHGTHVAGILFDNTMDNINIYSYRIFKDQYDNIPYLDFGAAINAAVSNGMDVINMSVKDTYDKVEELNYLYRIFDMAIDNGVVIVAAAGNDSGDVGSLFPASYDKVITVSATERNNKPDKTYTNYGNCVDIAAPGTDVYSCVPRNLVNDNNVDSNNYTDPKMYMRLSGTSQAAPLVSAAAALIKSIDPDITPAEVERIIKETAFVPEGWEESEKENENESAQNYGTGIVNFYNIAKAMLGEKSSTPVISKTTDNKFEISLPNGNEGDIFYTLDGSQPTTVNGLLYSEAIDLSDKNANEIKAVCHESGKVCGDTAVKDLVMRKSLKLDYKETYMTMPYEYAYKGLWFDTDKNIADSNYKGEITGKSPGTSNVVFKLPNGERIIYTVTVDYALWQKIIIYFFFGFLWYI